VLQNIENYPQGEKGVVQLSAETSSLKYGLWVNVGKNPRQKVADFPDLGISIEVSQQHKPLVTNLSSAKPPVPQLKHS